MSAVHTHSLPAVFKNTNVVPNNLVISETSPAMDLGFINEFIHRTTDGGLEKRTAGVGIKECHGSV